MKLSNLMKALTAATIMSAPSAFAHESHTVHPQENAVVAKKNVQQVPGFYHMQFGKDMLVTALYDGALNLTNNNWFAEEISADKLEEMFKAMFVPQTADGVQTSVNAFLIRQGAQTTLIDAGTAHCFGDAFGNLGHIVENLKAAGVRPEEVDNVVVTHLHPDHACGITNEKGVPNFPNATVYAAEEEAGFWLNNDNLKAFKEPHMAQFFKQAQDAVAPYKTKGKFKTFTKGATVVPGIDTVDEFGHTPGMTGYLIGSDNNRLLIWGDVVHSHSIQLKDPNVTIEVDVNRDMARETRKRILALAAENKLWVAAAHFPFPGIGHIVKDTVGYRWIPTEYLPLDAQ